MGLLIGNYRPEDAVRLAGWLATSSDRDEFHSIGFGMLDLLEAHPTTEGVPVLLALYESGPCSKCRCRAIELLHTLDAMPAWILKEAPFDASADIRQKLTEWATSA